MKNCQCEDSECQVCGKEMSREELEQDGMCGYCAGNVWHEMTALEEYLWYHNKNIN